MTLLHREEHVKCVIRNELHSVRLLFVARYATIFTIDNHRNNDRISLLEKAN